MITIGPSVNSKKDASMQDHSLLPETVQTALSEALEIGSQVQPFSAESVNKAPRIRGAEVVKSVCPYCAVGCGLNVYVRNGKVLDIEGNPDSPINHGTLCPKGAATFQYTINPNRLKHALYRAPYSSQWQPVTLDLAMEQIAQRVKKHATRHLWNGWTMGARSITRWASPRSAGPRWTWKRTI